LKTIRTTIKKAAVFALTGIMILSLAACSSQINPPSTSEIAVDGQFDMHKNTSETATSESSDASAAIPTSSPVQTQQSVRAIVFDETRKDIVAPDSNDPYAYCDSRETFKMTLYETSPGVFEGEGVGVTMLTIGSNVSEDSSVTRYRTERIELTSGVGQDVTLLYVYDAVHTVMEWSQAPALGNKITHTNYLQYEDFTWRLEMENDMAKLYFSEDDTEPYIGKCVTLPPDETPFQDVPADKVISVNSDGRQLRGQTNGHEYRGILTAEPSGGGFAGNLFLYGDGPGIPFCDEDVSFTVEAFDAQTYKNAGGAMPISADAMGVIHALAGDFIVLLDEEHVLLEVEGSDVTFAGGLISESEAEEAKYVADETKPIVKCLYDGTKEKTKSGGMLDGIPAWYPEWLMPKPISAEYQRYNVVPDTGGYNFYSFQYNEDQRGGTTAKTVMENYKNQLQGADGLEAIYDEETHYAIVRFNKGAYSIHILIDPPFPTVNVTIDIVH
jgi:hypothetical protein